MFWRHTTMYLTAQGLPGLVNLGAISIYSRLLGADEYGRYVFIIASVGLGNSQAVRATIALAFIAVIALLAVAGGLGLVLIQAQGLRTLWAASCGLLGAQALFDMHLTLVDQV
jgi:hypothetical protein